MSPPAHRTGKLLRFLPRLYRARQLGEFLDASAQQLSRLIECDGCGWFVYDLAGPRLRAVSESGERVLTPRLISAFERTAPTHPFLQLWATSRTAVQLSDLPQRTRLRWIDENWDIFREIGTGVLSVPVLVDRRQAVAVSYRRKRGAFTEDDRLMANLLQPHLRQAYLNAEAFTRSLSVNTPPAPLGDSLTDREHHVAIWLEQGKSNREIAVILDVSPRTVEKHVESILQKLGAPNRTAAALRFVDRLR